MHVLHVDDDGFVRAPRPLVYRRLTDVASWPRWWTGVGVAAEPPVDGRETWRLVARRDLLRSLRLHVGLHDFRHETGMALALSGDVSGRAEFWLEEVTGGVKVHHLLDGRTSRSPLPMLATYRAVVRRGLFGLRDALHAEVRTAIGLRP